MLVSAGCVSEEDRVYPTKLSSIEAREALGELTRSTNFAEVISRQPLPPRRKSEETAPRERTFPFVVEVVNGRKKVRLDIVKFLELAQANDITFLAYKESLASAEESLRATLRSYRPVFGGTVSASYNFKNDSESQGVNFSLSQKLPWNGSLKLATSADRSHYSSPPDRESMSLSTMLSLSLDIYLRPGGYAEWRESIIQAERNWVYSQRQFRRNRENYLINMVQLYYDTINARKSLESQNERLKKAQDAYDLVRFEYNRGRRTLTDVNVAEENLIDARQAIIDAKENYAELLDDLKLKLGIPQEYDIELVDEPLSVKPIGEIDMDEVIRKALANNPDYQTQRDRYEDRRRNFLLSLYRLRNVPHVNLPIPYPSWTRAPRATRSTTPTGPPPSSGPTTSTRKAERNSTARSSRAGPSTSATSSASRRATSRKYAAACANSSTPGGRSKTPCGPTKPRYERRRAPNWSSTSER